MRKFFLLLVLALLVSCVTNRKTTYLQDKNYEGPPGEEVVPDSYRIQVNDNLYIRVNTPDPKWSAMFNTIPTESSSLSVGEQSVDLLSYSVQADGTVEIPYLGALGVADLTLMEARTVVEDALTDYVSNASVTLKLVNNYISILGEVKNPGRYVIYKEQMNIFQALALAGDVSDFGNRFQVSVLRTYKDSTVVREFDLTEKDIIHTEFYYVLPNDVIYAKPMKGKFFAMNQFPFGLILSALTTFVLVISYIQTLQD